MHVHGFPNMFMAQLPQGAALASNVPHNYVEATKAIAAVVRHAVDREFAAVEATQEAEDAWVDYLLAKGRPAGRADCTPGYYNNEGQPRPESKLNVGYPQGATAFFAMLDEWRQAGTFTGLSFQR